MKRREFIRSSGAQASAWVLAPALLAKAASSDEGGPDNDASAAPRRIKIGQIGICHEHANRISTLRKFTDDYEVVGVVDDRDSKAARYGGTNLKPFEGLPWMSEEELFQVPGLEAVLIETANGDLVPTALRCMERGLAIAMDKPGGEEFAPFQKLLDGCESRGLPFQIGYMFRGNPAFQFCQEAVKKGWLGEVFEIQADMSHDYGNERYQHYLSAYAGGVMYNLGCHHIDIIVSLLGSPRDVVSFLGTTTGAVDGVKNNCLAVLEYPHARAMIHVCDEEPGGLAKRRFKISGDKGRIEFSPLERFDGAPLALQLHLKEGNDSYEAGTHLVEFEITEGRYDAQLREFARLVRKETESRYTPAHDALVQKVHLAASGYTRWSG